MNLQRKRKGKIESLEATTAVTWTRAWVLQETGFALVRGDPNHRNLELVPGVEILSKSRLIIKALYPSKPTGMPAVSSRPEVTTKLDHRSRTREEVNMKAAIKGLLWNSLVRRRQGSTKEDPHSKTREETRTKTGTGSRTTKGHLCNSLARRPQGSTKAADPHRRTRGETREEPVSHRITASSPSSSNRIRMPSHQQGTLPRQQPGVWAYSAAGSQPRHRSRRRRWTVSLPIRPDRRKALEYSVSLKRDDEKLVRMNEVGGDACEE